MQPHVTRGAIAIFGVEHVVGGVLREDAVSLPAESAGAVVAFEAHGEDNRAGQQPGIHGAVRPVAGLATLHALNAVLEHERSAFVHVAIETGFFIPLHPTDHAWARRHAPGRIEAAVRIVAIGALHGALVHAMLEGHIELRTHAGIAGVAKFGLRFRE